MSECQKSLNKLLKKLQDSDSKTRRTRSGWRRNVRSDASPVFTRYSTNIQNQTWIGPCTRTYLFQISYGVWFCEKLAKSDEIWQRYHRNKKGEVFWDTVQYIKAVVTCQHEIENAIISFWTCDKSLPNRDVRRRQYQHNVYSNELEATRDLKHPRRMMLPPGEHNGASVYAQSPNGK